MKTLRIIAWINAGVCLGVFLRDKLERKECVFYIMLGSSLIAMAAGCRRRPPQGDLSWEQPAASSRSGQTH